MASYDTLFDKVKDEPFPDIRPGARVWFVCNSERVMGCLRHLNRRDCHFGLNDRHGKNIGHFGWKVLPNGGVWVYRKTGTYQPPPNRRLELIARFVDLEEDEDEPRVLRDFFSWLNAHHYRIVRSDAEPLDTEALLVEYQSR